MTTPKPKALASRRELFLAALEKPTLGERAAFLDRACGGDTELRAAVEALLANHRDDAFLERPALAAAAGATEATAGVAEQPGDKIGRYKLREKIGEGGCGVVHVAEQEEPVRRRVALKVIKLGMDTRNVIARFEAERQALAMMDHPNIAKVLDAGATETGRPYFVMELVRGIKITDYCDQTHLATRERLNLFIKVCQAVQHAHQKGIIHRDLKPSNILVTLHDGVPVPKVIDFGIAKATEGRLTDLTVYTELHQFIGTPAYMSPEQAEMSGLDIDTRSDIYSLGVLLYELLTGKTPFDAKELLAAGLDEMRRTIREQEPVRPSTRLTQALEAADVRKRRDKSEIRNPKSETASASLRRLLQEVQGDLDWIVMKALEKDRTRRYETANGLARDLQRHLNNEPVVARPPSGTYRVWKFVRRNTVRVAAAATVAMVLVLGVLMSSWQAIRATQAERAQRRSREEAQKAQANEAQLRKHAEARAYAADMDLAHRAWTEGNLQRALGLLRAHLPAAAREDLRGFEWRYLWQLCRDESRCTFTNISFGARRRDLALASDARKVIAASGNVLKWLDPRSRRVSQTLSVGTDSDGPATLALSRPGLVAFRVGDRIKVLAAGRDMQWGADVVHERLNSLALSADGTLLASGGFDNTVRLWNVQSGTQVGHDLNLGEGILCLAFSPDGTCLACGTSETKVRLLKLPGLKEIKVLEGHTAWVQAVAFGPSGKQLVSSGNDAQIILWSFPEGHQTAKLAGHRGPVQDLAFSADGRWLASGGKDQTVRLWDLASPGEHHILRGHRAGVTSVLFSGNGEELYSAGEDGTVKVWPVRSDENQNILRHEHWLWTVAFSPDGNRLAVADTHGRADVLWDVASRRRIGAITAASPPEGEAFSPDGTFLATRDFGTGAIQVWNLSTSNKVFEFAMPRGGGSLVFHPVEPLLAAVAGSVQFWDLQTWHSRNLLANAPTQGASCGAFSGKGKWFALGREDGRVSLWDLTTGRELPSFHQYMSPVAAVCFSRDGRILASGGWDHYIILYDVLLRRIISRLDGHTDGVSSLAFASDDMTLVSTSWDGTIRFWGTVNWQLALTLSHDGGPVTSAAFSPDGKLMATSGSDGTVRLWPAPSLAEIDALERTSQKER